MLKTKIYIVGVENFNLAQKVIGNYIKSLKHSQAYQLHSHPDLLDMDMKDTNRLILLLNHAELKANNQLYVIQDHIKNLAQTYTNINFYVFHYCIITKLDRNKTEVFKSYQIDAYMDCPENLYVFRRLLDIDLYHQGYHFSRLDTIFHATQNNDEYIWL